MIRTLAPEATVVYDTVDLHFVNERRRAVIEDDRGASHSAAFHHDLELTLARMTDQTWVVWPVRATGALG